MVGADDHRVLLEEGVRSARRVHQALDLLVSGDERRHLGIGAVLVRVRVVVGKRQQEEVEEVVLHHVCTHASGVLVADARQPKLRAATCAAGGEEVGIEELTWSLHGLLEHGRRDTRERGFVGDFVPVASAVDEIRGAGGPDSCVIEQLEQRRCIGREMLRIHVVDRVGE